jgi:hypothetical protein
LAWLFFLMLPSNGDLVVGGGGLALFGGERVGAAGCYDFMGRYGL